MKIRHLLPILAGLLVFALVAGCATTPPAAQTTQTTAPPTQPPTAQTTAPPTTAAPTVTTPEPVRTLPPMYAVDVQVDGNGLSIDPKIIATFRGGQGVNFVSQIDVKLTREDGVIKEGKFVPPLAVNQAVELQTTTGNNNRVEIWISLVNGERYKTFDQVVPFRSFH